MVIEHLGLSLDELFAQHSFHFSLKTVLLLACQLESNLCLCSYTWLTSISSSVACSISILTTSFTVILSRATSSWVSTRMWTWSTLSILGYQSNSEILIHVRTFLIAKVGASPEQLASHPSIVTLDWSLEDEMIWSRSPMSLFISFVALYHGRGREETSFWWNNNSPRKTCITDFHWSFVPFWNSADHFPLIASPTKSAVNRSASTKTMCICSSRHIQQSRVLFADPETTSSIPTVWCHGQMKLFLLPPYFSAARSKSSCVLSRRL